ncbi:hypothetical protein COHA_008001 [Chlorella ohadii]|uniref:Cytochrome b5 heme-binding domain-containing protein n=1 Tax=Chlorella ohadii TaxID=2649997 RepID=A0AAD5H3N1_9CHLO|nr:hypothetical protein COHA_008001 [Chlorella ohadii]
MVEDPVTAVIALTAEEVAKHNTSADCWYVNGNSVYDVTQFMADELHPEGNEVIIPFCGKDATEEFNRQHRGSRAREEQELYLLGPLVV